MHNYAFFLGTASDLAFAELCAVCARYQIQSQPVKHASVATLKCENELDSEFFNSLGGTIKVGEIKKTLPSLSAEISSEIAGILNEDRPSKIDFGISFYTTSKLDLNQLVKNVKTELAKNAKVRFVLPKFPSQELTSVVIKKQKLTDVCVIESENDFFLARTIWVQDFEDWSKRDYGRPQAAGHIGMLPPKVARMMANLGLPSTKKDLTQATLLDPFCGVGTVLAEALVLGTGTVIGTDIDPKQVQRTKENLDWLVSAYMIKSSYKVFSANAVHLSESVPHKVDTIVTEPDLGPNNPQQTTNPEVVQKLTNLYVAALANWTKILAENGRVVIVLPEFMTRENMSDNNKNDLVKTVVDKAKLMGYSVEAGPFQYFRPQAVVKRNIIVFKLSSSLATNN